MREYHFDRFSHEEAFNPPSIRVLNNFHVYSPGSVNQSGENLIILKRHGDFFTIPVNLLEYSEFETVDQALTAANMFITLNNEEFGASAEISRWGDFNGDGLLDFFLNRGNIPQSVEGDIHYEVVFGREEFFGEPGAVIDSFDVSLVRLQASLVREDAGSTPLGRFPTLLGDINGDGVDDMVVGEFNRLFGEHVPDYIENYILLGAPQFGEEVLDLSDRSDWRLIHINKKYEFSELRDYNSDGFDDFLVERYDSDHGKTFAGVVFGSDDVSDIEDQIQSIENGSQIALDFDYPLGTWPDLYPINDFNGDGWQDFVATHAIVSGGYYSGTIGISVLFGSPEGFSEGLDVTDLRHGEGILLTGVEINSASRVLPAGDLDGDGRGDLVIPKIRETIVLFGSDFDGATEVNVAQLHRKNAYTIEDRTLIVPVGDTNDDGIDDLMIADHHRYFLLHGANDQDLSKHNYIHGTAGSDHLDAGEGNDSVEGDTGGDSIYGEAGRDVLAGGRGADTLFGGAGRDTLFGDEDEDFLDGGSDDDMLYGGGGADHVKGGFGDDFADGGEGEDRIEGGVGKDVLHGGEDADNIFGGGDDDSLFGGSGGDRIGGGDGEDFLSGDDGGDRANGGTGADRLWGGKGQDTLIGGSGNDSLFGGNEDHERSGNSDFSLWFDGNDLVKGKSGDDLLRGEQGDDTLRGGAGDDTLFGDQSHDVLKGGRGSDELFGGEGDDVLFGQGHNDSLFGGEGFDRIKGGGGADYIVGGEDNDTLYGNGGADTILGGDGFNSLHGGGGPDHIRLGSNTSFATGNGGDDYIYGSGGSDTIVGGGGNDTIIAHSQNSGRDFIFVGRGDDLIVSDSYTTIDSFYYFRKNDGFNHFEGFNHGEDFVVFVPKSAGYSDLTISQHDDDVLVEYENTKILVIDDLVDDFSKSDFIFLGDL